MRTAKTRDEPTRRLRRLGSVVAGVASAVLLATPVFACGYIETGPSTCGPMELEQIGNRELSIAIGSCYMPYGPDVPENRAGAYGEAWLEGPSGFRHDFVPDCFYYTVCQVERQTLSVPSAGTYTLWSHTWGTIGLGLTPEERAAAPCYEGYSEVSLTVVDPSGPVPQPQPAPVPPQQPAPVPAQQVAPPTPFPTAPPPGAPTVSRPPSIGQGAEFNSPANAYELVVGATVAVLLDLTLWAEPAAGESEHVLAAGSLARIVTGATAADGWYWYQLTDGSLTGWVKGGSGSEANLNAIPFIASSRPSVVTPTNTPPNEDPAALVAGAWGDPATRTLMLAGAGAGILVMALVILCPGRRTSKPRASDPE